MSVWNGPEDRPGGLDSLFLMYYLVPVAEEFDLCEEVGRGTPNGEVGDGETTLSADDNPTYDEHSIGNVTDLLMEQLGAEIIEDEAEEPPEA